MAPKIKYDKIANILSIKVSNKKSVDSDMKNNIVVDYDEDGDIVNIDVMKINFNEFKQVSKLKLVREAMQNI